MDKAPIPSLLAVSAVHHHLIKTRKRMQIDIVVESAEPREVMHFALLFGYGASIINPYMCFAVIEKLVKDKAIQLDYQKAEANYVNSINKGILKIMSKMGISTLRSYRSSQIFEAVGIHTDVIDKYFAGTTSRIGGIGMAEIAEEVLIPHRKAFSNNGQQCLKYLQKVYIHTANTENIMPGILKLSHSFSGAPGLQITRSSRNTARWLMLIQPARDL